MPKRNARTFRYSDEVKLILEKYNNDFDSLVVEAFLRLPAVEEQSKRISEYNETLLIQRSNLLKDIRNLDSIKKQLLSVEECLVFLEEYIKKM